MTTQLVDLVAATRAMADAQQARHSGASAAQAELQHMLAQWGQAQTAVRQSLDGIRQAVLDSAPPQQPARQAHPQPLDLAVQQLGQLVLQSLQPVVEHLDQSRRQQLGLHRVLLQVAARLQEQIDQQRAGRLPVQPTLQADDIDKAFDRMQDPRPPA